MIGCIAIGLALAAAEPAGAPAAPQGLPDEKIVLDLRRARLAETTGDAAKEKEILDGLVASHPDDPTALAGALAFYRRTAPDAEGTRSLASRLVAAIAAPGRAVPAPLIAEIVRDPKAPPDELERLLAILAERPGEGADLVRRLKLRVAILDRLGRPDETLRALEALLAADPDPVVAQELVRRYVSARRWDDVLKTADALAADRTWMDVGWYRMEAYGALKRFDDLATEADALLGRLASAKAPAAIPTAGPRVVDPQAASNPSGGRIDSGVAAAFYPIVFQLLDAGRREPAERLIARLDEATGHAEAVRRIRVMVFGSPAERSAYLEDSAKSALGSGDPTKIRLEADKRLLEKDYRTAYDLFRHLVLADPDAFTDDLSGWFNYGLSAAETEHWDDVETAMTRVLSLDPRMSRALAQRARARIMRKRFAEGIADARAALAIDPASKQACYAMYLAYQTQGDAAQAQEWLRKFKAP